MKRPIPPPVLYGVERKRQTGGWAYTFTRLAFLHVIPESDRICLLLEMTTPSLEELKGQSHWYCDREQKALDTLLETVVEVLRKRALARIKYSEDMAERCLIHARQHRRCLDQLGGVVDPPTLWERLDAD